MYVSNLTGANVNLNYINFITATGTNLTTSFLKLNQNSISLGSDSGLSNQGTNSIAIGYQAGSANQASQSIAIGYQAGYTGQGVRSVAIGYQAGYTGQAAQSVAIGYHIRSNKSRCKYSSTWNRIRKKQPASK